MKDDGLKKKLEDLDMKVDKAFGVNVKPVHYVMIVLLLLGLLSNFLN